MLDLQLLRDNPERVRRAIQAKALGDGSLVDRVLDLDARRRAVLTETQAAQTAANAAAKEIGALMQAGRRDEAEAKKREAAEGKATVQRLEAEARALEAEFERALLELPNLPHESVPEGRTEADNVVAYAWGHKPVFAFTPRPHWDLVARAAGTGVPLVDFERGAKVTGAGFPFYVGKLARLQRALIGFFLDEAAKAGYTEVQPPLLVNADSATATGQLPDNEGQMYEAPADGLYLIPTAEVPVTNLLRGEILAEADLPLRLAAYTPCFRREAGSYGKDVRGLNRLHQFDKVELVQIVHPDRSYDALEELRAHSEGLLVKLGLPYHRLLMCTGDMGFTQAKKYDLEVWSAGQDRWLEVSSVSNFEAFQARRLNLRFRPEGGGKPEFVHTLNGSGLALPRTVAALLEAGQHPDGTVRLPEVLVPYTGFETLD
ncbi:MAG TPA: serine--tRNA ligase [Rhodothermales bacterium]|nr:serine--tRNA ligase [Rhodothermales bacterium]